MNWETDFTACVNIKTRFSVGFFYLVLCFQYTDDIVYCTYSCSMKRSFTLSFA